MIGVDGAVNDMHGGDTFKAMSPSFHKGWSLLAMQQFAVYLPEFL